MKNEEIKAVDLVRRIRDEHYAILKGKSAAERRQFYRERAKKLQEELAKTRDATKTA